MQRGGPGWVDAKQTGWWEVFLPPSSLKLNRRARREKQDKNQTAIRPVARSQDRRLTADMAFFVNGDELGPAHEVRWANKKFRSQIGNAARPS